MRWRSTIDIVEALGSESFVYGHPASGASGRQSARTMTRTGTARPTTAQSEARAPSVTVRLGREYKPVLAATPSAWPAMRDDLLFSTTRPASEWHRQLTAQVSGDAVGGSEFA